MIKGSRESFIYKKNFTIIGILYDSLLKDFFFSFYKINLVINYCLSLNMIVKRFSDYCCKLDAFHCSCNIIVKNSYDYVRCRYEI